MSKCIITGCGLDIGGESYYWGDLHEQGDQWIFNGTTRQGEAREVEKAAILGRPSLHTDHAVPRFERRGVFIIPKAASELNNIAQEYLKK